MGKKKAKPNALELLRDHRDQLAKIEATLAEMQESIKAQFPVIADVLVALEERKQPKDSLSSPSEHNKA